MLGECNQLADIYGEKHSRHPLIPPDVPLQDLWAAGSHGQHGQEMAESLVPSGNLLHSHGKSPL